MKINWDSYRKQAETYLKRDVFSGTPLTGKVLAKSAKKTYEETGKYIPVDFALAQAQRESSMGRKGRSPKNNPYNIGEFDKGSKIKFNNMQEGVQAYFDLIANDYLVDGKTTDDLMKDFVNKDGNRYASDKKYESYFQQQVPYIQKYLKKQTGFDLSSLNLFSATNAYGAETQGQENTMAQTVQDPRESLNLLQKLLTSPQANAIFSTMDSAGQFMKNPIESSGEVARKGVDAAIGTIKENPEQALGIIKSLMSKTNVGPMISAAEGAGKFAKGFMDNNGQAQAAETKSPYQEGVNKALKKLGEEQAVEAVKAGVSIQKVEQQAQQMSDNNIGSALAGQSQEGQQTQGQQTSGNEFDLIKPNILQKLFDALPEGRSRQVGRLLREQKLTGKEPLQEGEREKLSMNFLSKVMSSSGKKSLSSDAVKNLENAKTAVDQSTLLINEFSKDPNLFKSWGGPGDARGQQVGFIVKNLSDTVGRLRSGGAINDEELKTFRSFLPKQGVIKGRLEDKKTVLFKLQTINKLFQGVVNGIQPASQAADLTEKIQEALNNGYKPEEITKYLGL